MGLGSDTLPPAAEEPEKKTVTIRATGAKTRRAATGQRIETGARTPDR